MATAALMIVAWRFDRYRVGILASFVGGSLSVIALVALSLSFRTNLNEDFIGDNYVSKFARSGVEAILEFADHGFLEADARAIRDLQAAPDLKAAPRRLVMRHANSRTSSCCTMNSVSTLRQRPE